MRARWDVKSGMLLLSLTWLALASLSLPVGSLPAFAQVPGGAPEAEYRVGPGDVLDISVFAGGEGQEHLTGAVAPDGKVICPLVGPLHAAGRTVADLSSDLRARLAREYYRDPRVVVVVREFGATVAVAGEVRHPGVYRLNQARTALGACVLAGGFTDFASARSVRLVRMRDGKPQTLRLDLARVSQGRSSDVQLEAGDRLDVPRRLL